VALVLQQLDAGGHQRVVVHRQHLLGQQVPRRRAVPRAGLGGGPGALGGRLRGWLRALLVLLLLLLVLLLLVVFRLARLRGRRRRRRRLRRGAALLGRRLLLRGSGARCCPVCRWLLVDGRQGRGQPPPAHTGLGARADRTHTAAAGGGGSRLTGDCACCVR
jgi:hypothetical protein